MGEQLKQDGFFFSSYFFVFFLVLLSIINLLRINVEEYYKGSQKGGKKVLNMRSTFFCRSIRISFTD